MTDWDTLLTENRKLNETARKIQQDKTVGLSNEEIAQFSGEYQRWYARGLANLPEDLKSRFRAEFECSIFSYIIKSFLEGPIEVSILFQSSDENGKKLLSYWLHPYEQQFYPYILSQRQTLIEMKMRQEKHNGENSSLEELLTRSSVLENIANKIQSGENVGLGSAEIDAFIDAYYYWFAECLAILPEDLKENFRSEYDKGPFSLKIRRFLEAPDKRNLFYESKKDPGQLQLFDYWQYPYKSTFYGPLVAQRQILIEAQERKPAVSVSPTPTEEVVLKSSPLPENQGHHYQNPWKSGSFYLIGFLSIIIILLIAGKVLPLFTLPIVVICGILALAIIGALQLRQDNRLTEENFLNLVSLSLTKLFLTSRRDENPGKGTTSTP